MVQLLWQYERLSSLLSLSAKSIWLLMAFCCLGDSQLACAQGFYSAAGKLASRAGVERAERPSTTEWTTEIAFEQFHIHCDFALQDADFLQTSLESLADDLKEVLGVVSRDNAIHIVLFETETEYRRYMSTYFPQLPVRRALFIKDRGPGMLFAYWHSEVLGDLRHEVTHALLNSGSQPLPLWLDEGIAEYFEIAAEARYRENPYLVDVSNTLNQTSIQSLSELEQKTNLADLNDSDYRDAWAWVHFLIHRSPKSRQMLQQFLLSSRHRPPKSSTPSPTPSGLSLARMVADMDSVEAQFLHHFASLQNSPGNRDSQSQVVE